MKRIFVYEFLSGGGCDGDGAAADGLLDAGVAMRDAIVTDLLCLPGVATRCAVSARPDAAPPPCPPDARLATVSPREGEPAEDFVARMAREHDLVWVVAPETGGMLARLHDAVGDGRWIGCSGPAIRIAASKRSTAAVLAARGVPTPSAFAAAHRGRWIVKPDDGAGAVDTRVHWRRDAALADLQQREAAGHEATLEPFIEGEALSLSLLAAPHRLQPIAFNRQQLEIDAEGLLHDRGVRSHAIDPQHDPRVPRLQALARDVGHALAGLRGFVGIDVVWHPERGPVVIEVNPRVTCAYVGLSAKLHCNLAAKVLSSLQSPWSVGDAIAA